MGYIANIWLNSLRISATREREAALTQELLRLKKVLIKPENLQVSAP